MVDFLPCCSFSVEAGSKRSSSWTGDVGQIRLNVEGEGSEVLDIDSLTSTQLGVQVGDQCSPNDHHLEGEISVLAFMTVMRT